MLLWQSGDLANDKKTVSHYLSNAPVLNGQNEDGWNTNQNQIKNINPFHIVFEVLKVLLIIIWIEPLDLLFLVVLC